jgi:hypothetical protein
MKKLFLMLQDFLFEEVKVEKKQEPVYISLSDLFLKRD